MCMKITITELKKIIRDTIKECYGWPVESEKPLYNAPTNIGKPSKHDPKNSPMRMPKGPNSRGVVKESFNKITARELAEWRNGNLGFIAEMDEAATCESCGASMEGVQEGEGCSECGAY